MKRSRSSYPDVPRQGETYFSPLKVTVVGCGSIGQRHVRNLRSLGVADISGVDSDASKVEAAGIYRFASLEEALRERPDAVFICTPPSIHVDQAIQALEAGSHVFVEKPIAHTLDAANSLLAVADASDRLVQVGYNLRHIYTLKVLRKCMQAGLYGRPLWARLEVGQYLPDWRPSQDYRTSYTARRSLGGGIILDASHEIDLALWMFGKPVELCCMAGKVSDLEMDVEDTATILIRFESGMQADVHLDCIQRQYSRGFKIAFEKNNVEWFFPQNELIMGGQEQVIRCTGNQEEEAEDLSGIFEPFHPEKEGTSIKPYDPNDMYVREVQDFLDCLVGGIQSNSLREGIEALVVALAAREAAEQRRWVKLA